MAESQSRYGIVEKLTSSKLAILEEMISIKDQIQVYEATIINHETAFKNWAVDNEARTKTEERQKIAQIEQAKRELENMKIRVSAKEEVIKEKIKTIEYALIAVEEISKSSPTINK